MSFYRPFHQAGEKAEENIFRKVSTSQALKQKVTELQDYEAFHQGWSYQILLANLN